MSKSDQLEVSVLPKGQMDAIQKKLDILCDTLEEIKKSYQPKEPAVYLSRKEAAEMLGITFATLYAWDKKGILQRYAIENRVYYKRSEIEAAMQQT